MPKFLNKVLCWFGRHNTNYTVVKPDAYHRRCFHCKEWVKEAK